MPQMPDYGIDAPGVIRNLFVIGVVLIPVGMFLPHIRIGNVILILNSMAYCTGGACLLEGVLMIVYAKYGKFRHRDRMLT